jgi:putative ABC transport system permease protein
MITTETQRPPAPPRDPGPLRSALRGRDVLSLAATGLRARPTRAILSALGIAIGIAAMIAVVGISSSSQARLNHELNRLGTNLLTATAGTSLTGEQSRLPVDTVDKLRLIDDVLDASSTALLAESVYRSELSDPAATGGISAMVAEQNLLDVVSGGVRSGAWLNPATGSFPTVALGDTAAKRLGIVTPGTKVWLGGSYFTVVGILEPVALAPELDTAALVGEAVATSLFGFDGSPTTVYERSDDASVDRIRDLLAPTISPQAPEEVKVSRPSDALAARHAANQAFTGLLLGIGSIALLVGGIGVANTMIISVIERRREIGLRRALGATRHHILVQFLGEALLLSALGGIFGSAFGTGATIIMANFNGWPFALPSIAIVVAIGATLAVGTIAGLYPALRAARTPPTAALSS